MSNLFTFKDHFKESQLYLNRTVAATVIVFLLLIGLGARLVYLQVYQYDIFKTLSFNNQMRIVPIVPARGLIFDRNGVLLADNKPAFSLEITPERTDDIEETLDKINEIIPLSESDRQNFYKQLKYKPKSEGIPVRMKLNEEEVAKFSLEKYRFSGVDIVARLVRHYPLGERFAHAIGYIGPISEKDQEEIDPVNYRGTYYIGKIGVEKYYEELLHGKVGYQHVETDARGRTIRVLNRIAPTPGTNLHLSIDSELQKAAYDALEGMKGVIIALDPKTGGVLAMASNPSFDPNLFAQGIDAVTYKALQNHPDKPLFNRAIRGQYPPGSTIKPFYALQALDLGIITPHFTIFDPGFYQLNGAGRLYRDWIYHKTKHGHGRVDLEKAIIVSCDTYFFTVANKMGIRAIHDGLIRFGIGKYTGIDMTGESLGLAPSPEWKRRTYNEKWYGGDTISIGIGQGMLMATPIQMAQAVMAIANRGRHYKPQMVKAFANQKGELQPLPPSLADPIEIDDKNWDFVINAMHKVVHSPGGTAYIIGHDLQYQLAGKTGTAQVFNLKQGEKYQLHKIKSVLRDHSWFIGFAPYDNPTIAIAVLIENAETKTGKMVAKTFLDSYFKVKPKTPPPTPDPKPGVSTGNATGNPRENSRRNSRGYSRDRMRGNSPGNANDAPPPPPPDPTLHDD